MRSKAIGVDSDSLGAVCVLVDVSISRVVVQEYAITDEALGRFVRWVRQYPDAVVALEGHHGDGKPFECALRRAALPFHSFSAFEVSRFRAAVLGQNKNNQRDAEAERHRARFPVPAQTGEAADTAEALRAAETDTGDLAFSAGSLPSPPAGTRHQ